MVLTPGGGGGGSLWRAGFLPAEHQGIAFNDAEVEPEKMIANLRNQWLDPAAQPKQLDAVQALNREYGSSFGADSFLEGRIKSMEAAYRMQAHVELRRSARGESRSGRVLPAAARAVPRARPIACGA